MARRPITRKSIRPGKGRERQAGVSTPAHIFRDRAMALYSSNSGIEAGRVPSGITKVVLWRARVDAT